MNKDNIKDTNTVFKLNKLKKDSFILYHHLGLGDSVVCNGMANYLTKHYSKIYIPSPSPYYKMIKHLYKNNSKIEIFEISNGNRDNFIYNFSFEKKLQILKVGFEKVGKKHFNKAFYRQLNLPYSYSFKYFSLPEDSRSIELSYDLINRSKIDKNNYSLIHKESHDNNLQLKLMNNQNRIFVTKNTDKFKNIFLYNDLIKNAKEIHCINSSFLHLVERVDTSAKLFFHNIRGGRVFLKNNWKIIKY